MIGQVHSNVKAINETSTRHEIAATEGFDIDETPRPAAARCTGCAGAERIPTCASTATSAPGDRDRSNRHDTPPCISPGPQFNERRRYDKENQVRRPENG